MAIVEYIPVLVRRLLAYLIGLFYAIPVICALIISAVKSRGKSLQTKKRDKKPECLEDPAYGEHKFIYLEEVKLHYVVNGKPDKPLMIFIHGFPECWYSWRYQLKEFSTDYRVVAIDQRGYNQSDKPSGVLNYTVEKLVKDIKQLIPALGYNKCILVGHDWGGITCWGTAMLHPDVVDKLVIMNAPHPRTFLPFLTSTWTQFKKSWYMFLFQLPCLPEFLWQSNDMKMMERCLAGRRSGVRSNKLSKEDVEAYKYAFSAKGAFTGPINYIRAMTRVKEPLETVREVCCPTLLLWGDQDSFLDTELVSASSQYVSKMTAKYIEGASHWVQMDKPDVVNKLMREFLKEK